VGFEPGPEDSYGRYGSDKIRQTVPDASSGNRKSSVTDGRQSGAAGVVLVFVMLLKSGLDSTPWFSKM